MRTFFTELNNFIQLFLWTYYSTDIHSPSFMFKAKKINTYGESSNSLNAT